MLTNDLLKRHMFKFGVTSSYKSQGMTNKSLFYVNEQYANELICIFIQFFKKRISSLSM